MTYKIEEKRFLESAIISNTQGILASNWFNSTEFTPSQIVEFSVNLSLEQLRQRNELYGVKEKVVKEKIKEKENIDIDEIIDIFNSVCFALPSVSKSTVEREKAIYKILETYTTQDIGTVFKNVSESDYLCGKKVGWKADFDWIFVPKNFIKILEGKYKNIENGQNNNNQYTASSSIKEKIARGLFS